MNTPKGFKKGKIREGSRYQAKRNRQGGNFKKQSAYQSFQQSARSNMHFVAIPARILKRWVFKPLQLFIKRATREI